MNKKCFEKRIDFSRKRVGVREELKKIIILCEGEKNGKILF